MSTKLVDRSKDLPDWDHSTLQTDWSTNVEAEVDKENEVEVVTNSNPKDPKVNETSAKDNFLLRLTRHPVRPTKS